MRQSGGLDISHFVVAVFAFIVAVIALGIGWVGILAPPKARVSGPIDAMNMATNNQTELQEDILHVEFVDPDGKVSDVYMPGYLQGGRHRVQWQMLPADCDFYWDGEAGVGAITQKHSAVVFCPRSGMVRSVRAANKKMLSLWLNGRFARLLQDSGKIAIDDPESVNTPPILRNKGQANSLAVSFRSLASYMGVNFRDRENGGDVSDKGRAMENPNERIVVIQLNRPYKTIPQDKGNRGPIAWKSPKSILR